MAKDPKDVNPDLVRQEVEKGRVGHRALARKPGKVPEIENDGESVVWDDDQRQLVENQDMTEIEKAERKRPA